MRYYVLPNQVHKNTCACTKAMHVGTSYLHCNEVIHNEKWHDLFIYMIIDIESKSVKSL